LDIEALGLGLTPAEYTNRQSLRAAITTARTLAATVAHKAELGKIKSANAKDMLHLREKADLAAANAQEIERLHAARRDRSSRAAAELTAIDAMDREAFLLQREERKQWFMEEMSTGKTSHYLMSSADRPAKAQGLSVARPLSEASTGAKAPNPGISRKQRLPLKTEPTAGHRATPRKHSRQRFVR
jgi:hypothetical protein